MICMAFFKKIGFVILMIGLTLSSAHAADFSMMGGEVKGTLDTTLSYATMWRVSDQEKGRAGMTDPNFDDGNRNFDTGLVSNIGKILYDFRVQKDQGDNTIGLFSRGYALWDTKVKNASNDNDSPTTNNSGPLYGGSLSRTNKFTEKTEDRSGADVDFLDLFLFGEFAKSSNHPFSLRVGKQVVSWGESLFIQTGISSVINPADVSKAKLPGTEVKEILLPVYQISGSVSATPNLSFGVYYQFKWENTIAPPTGTFLSTNDFIADDGAEKLLIPVLPPPAAPFVSTPYLGLDRAGDMDADDSGQWGVSVNWYSEAINDTEFGLFYLNYHRKLPDLVIMSDGLGSVDHIWTGPPIPPLMGAVSYFDSARYAHKYYEDVKLMGFSWNTMLPFVDTALSGEIAYHHDIPVQTTSSPDGLKALAPDGVPAPGKVVELSTREEMVIAQVTFNKDMNIPAIADDIGFLVEFGVVHVLDLDDGEIFRGPRPCDQTAWGYKAMLNLTYYDAFASIWSALSSVDLTVKFTFNHDVDGVSAIPAGSFTEDEKSVGIGFEASWQNVLSFNMAYNNFFGAGDKSAISDRDNVSCTLKYRF
ncbi:MAG: DUF1302 domain-containing protein [Deltaproteobacteria bacterium]|nr:DUF1302 domain-containing protein [Deltaproteobacteria bacterium]